MTKKEFIKSLEEIVLDKILITDEVEILKKEISENCWSISGKEETITQVKIEDIRMVLERIKSSRKEQLNQSKYEIDLIYYSWFDEQSCQLRFSLINSNHKKLPFKTQILLVTNENEIIDSFLNSKYHNGISFEEFDDADVNRIQEKKKSEIKVYKELIKKEK